MQPFVQASDVLAEMLAKQDKAGAAEGVKARKAADVPSLTSLFRAGQLVQCSIIDLQDAVPKTGGCPDSPAVLPTMWTQKQLCRLRW